MNRLKDEEIDLKSQEYNKICHFNHTSGEEPSYHFINGVDYAVNYYEIILKEIEDKIYGREKMEFIKVHLLRFFKTEELAIIRDFLIDRTPEIKNNE